MANNDYSLKKSNIQFSPFESTEYKPIKSDLTQLANSLNKLENREIKATEENAKLTETFAKLKSQLHADKETQQWFKELEDNTRNTIKEFSQFGDYSNALKYATNLAAETVNNGELQARIKNNAQINDYLAKVEARNDINKTTKDRLKDQAEASFSFKPIYDKTDGTKIISGEDWKPEDSPVKHITDVEIASTIKELMTEERQQWTNVYEDGTSDGVSYVRLRSEKINEMYNALLKDHNILDSINQEYKDNAWEIDKLDKELSNPNLTNEQKAEKLSRLAVLNQDMFDGPVINDPIKYSKNKIGKLLDSIAYENRNTVTKKYVRNPGSPNKSNTPSYDAPGENLRSVGAVEVDVTDSYERIMNTVNNAIQQLRSTLDTHSQNDDYNIPIYLRKH